MPPFKHSAHKVLSAENLVVSAVGAGFKPAPFSVRSTFFTQHYPLVRRYNRHYFLIVKFPLRWAHGFPFFPREFDVGPDFIVDILAGSVIV